MLRSQQHAIRSTTREEAFIPTSSRVVLDHAGYALFSAGRRFPGNATPCCPRSKLPLGLPLYRHYGLYAYRVGFLRHYPSLSPAQVERFGALEQLRALCRATGSRCGLTKGHAWPGRRYQQDLDRVRALYAAGEV